MARNQWRETRRLYHVPPAPEGMSIRRGGSHAPSTERWTSAGPEISANYSKLPPKLFWDQCFKREADSAGIASLIGFRYVRVPMFDSEPCSKMLNAKSAVLLGIDVAMTTEIYLHRNWWMWRMFERTQRPSANSGLSVCRT
jgi:hypothetical protein